MIESDQDTAALRPCLRRTCALGTGVALAWSGMHRPAMWLQAGSVGGDRPLRSPRPCENRGLDPLPNDPSVAKFRIRRLGSLSHAAHRELVDAEPAPRLAATPPAGPPRVSRPAPTTTGQLVFLLDKGILRVMATIVTSVDVVPGRLPNAPSLDAALDEIRQRFPRAIVDRYLELLPRMGKGVLIAPGAAVVGDVALGTDVSIWYGCVLRGDVAGVEVGDRSNIQDGSVLHVADANPCIVGAEVVVGHRAMLHACRIDDGCLIGMQATVLDGAVIGMGSIVGAGAVVTPGTIVPPRSLVLGCPGRVVRSVQEQDEHMHRALAHKYVRLKENYLRDAWAQPDRRTP